jgi:acyl carrier protein
MIVQDVRWKVNRILEPIADRKATDIVDQDRLVEDLGLDSLDRAELQLALEEGFEREIPDPVFEKWATVGDMIEWLSQTGEA